MTLPLSLLHGAREGGYAVGAFNMHNEETTEALVRAAEVDQGEGRIVFEAPAFEGVRPFVAADEIQHLQLQIERLLILAAQIQGVGNAAFDLGQLG